MFIAHLELRLCTCKVKRSSVSTNSDPSAVWNICDGAHRQTRLVCGPQEDKCEKFTLYEC